MEIRLDFVPICVCVFSYFFFFCIKFWKLEIENCRLQCLVEPRKLSNRLMNGESVGSSDYVKIGLLLLLLTANFHVYYSFFLFVTCFLITPYWLIDYLADYWHPSYIIFLLLSLNTTQLLITFGCEVNRNKNDGKEIAFKLHTRRSLTHTHTFKWTCLR